jgi:NIMA (never in mitosis gene a)-related kinase 2
LITSDTEDEDDVAIPPSPTRQKSIKNPFKPAGARPQLIAQNTATLQKLNSQSNIFTAAAATKAQTAPTLPTLSSQPDLRPVPSANALKERPSSPNRRLSKIPSSTTMALDASPQRKPSFTKKSSGNNTNSNSGSAEASGSDLNKLAIKNNMVMAQAQILKATNVAVMASQAPKGRTLVELAQARAGGRPIEVSDDGSPKGKRFADRMAQRERETGKEKDAPTWDPERDEMPSPFLVRHKAPLSMRGRS